MGKLCEFLHFACKVGDPMLSKEAVSDRSPGMYQVRTPQMLDGELFLCCCSPTQGHTCLELWLVRGL